jgi:isopentenyl-diphosphate delta-isomerase
MTDSGFISRKADHLRIALLPESRSSSGTGLDCIRLEHDSLPDLDLESIDLRTEVFSVGMSTPFFIAGMTAGHPGADGVNALLAKQAARRGWVFGVGSQRREIDTAYQDSGVQRLRERHPELFLISNLGIAQLVEVARHRKWLALREMLERSGARALAIHLNPIQECVQTEGTPRFQGSWQAVVELCERIDVPLVLKETGSGMSRGFLERIKNLPIRAVDVSGLGGTHWGRVEGLRAGEVSRERILGETFGDWGIPTAESILNAVGVFSGQGPAIWASGGIRNGLDAAKCIALGAGRVGFAGAALSVALKGEEVLEEWMATVEQELRIALFCTQSAGVENLRTGKKWSRV